MEIRFKRFCLQLFAMAALPAALSAAGLPAGFSEVPYLEGNGKQWILTDYRPDWTKKITVKFRVAKFGPWDYSGVFCSRGSAGNDDRGFLIDFGDGDASRPNLTGPLQIWTGGWALNTGIRLEIGTDCEATVDSFNKKAVIGEQEMNISDRPEFIGGSPLVLFAGHRLGDQVQEGSRMQHTLKGRIYFLKVFSQEGTLELDLVPARNLKAESPTKQYGMYDKVNGKFYPNSGTEGSFTTDPTVKTTHVVDRADYDSDLAAGTALLDLLDSTSVGSGDLVEISAGTKAAPKVYRLSRPAVVKTDKLTVYGSSGDPAATVLDGAGETACLVATGAGCAISALTVRDGVGYEADGLQLAGGIAAIGAKTVISNCVVTGCSNVGREAKIRGGGVYLKSSELVDSLVSACVISNDQAAAGTTAFYGGGVYGERQSAIRRVEVAGCLAVNNQLSAGGWDTGAMYGAGISVWHDGSLVEDCYVHGNEIACGERQRTGREFQNFGAGVSVHDGALVRRSMITGNRSAFSYPGLFLGWSTCAAEGCTISSNVLDGVTAANGQSLMCGGGIGVQGDQNPARGQSLRDCLVEGNRIVQKADWNAGGGAGCLKNGTKVIGGVFRANDSNGAAGSALLVTGTGVVFSNVVFEANGREGLNSKGTVHFRYQNQAAYAQEGTVVRDCWFVDNESSGDEGSAIAINFSDKRCDVEVVNSLFKGNRGFSVVGGDVAASGVGATLSFENCTFVDNPTRFNPVWCTSCGWQSISELKTPYAQFFKNCAFWRNGQKGDISALPEKYSSLTNTCYSYDPSGIGFPVDTSRDYHNLTAADFADPKFKGPDQGLYTLRGVSGLVNKGLLLGWMGRDDKKSPVRDLGDGTFTEEPAATITVRGQSLDVGAVVTRNESHQRLAGGAPDIGCFEFWSQPRFLLMVR